MAVQEQLVRPQPCQVPRDQLCAMQLLTAKTRRAAGMHVGSYGDGARPACVPVLHADVHARRTDAVPQAWLRIVSSETFCELLLGVSV